MNLPRREKEEGGGQKSKWLKTELQAIQIGPLVLVVLPGEVFVEYGLRIKQEAPVDPARTIVLGYSNHFFGYVPTAQAFHEGGYEVDYTQVTSDAEEIIVKKAVQLITRLTQGNENGSP